jgi:hypothetical protein
VSPCISLSPKYQELSVLCVLDWDITFPNSTQPWVNGQMNHISWVKGLLDEITGFDVELARLSSDSLIFLASNGT